MERAFICDGSKYTISGTNTIGLPVLLQDLPSEIEVEGNKLLLKSTFHVSLVCINQIIKKYNVLIPNFRDSVLNDFCDFIKTNSVELLNYSGEFRFSFKNDLKTVIAMCEVLNLNKFFELINQKYGLNIEYPPTHVTLYSLDAKSGVFLIDVADLKDFTKIIPNLIGHVL